MCVHRLGVQKRAKLEKRCVFGHTDKLWKGHDRQIRKNACKNTYLESVFIPEKYVFRVCFESPFTRMISSLKYKCPPPPPPVLSIPVLRVFFPSKGCVLIKVYFENLWSCMCRYCTLQCPPPDPYNNLLFSAYSLCFMPPSQPMK